MEREPDKPPGTEQHPPDTDPARRGPEKEEPAGPPTEDEDERPQREPPPEASPGEEGVTSPRR
jgi:hypothetical protein